MPNKLLSNRTPGLLMELGRQLQADKDRRRKRKDAERLDDLANKFSQLDDRSATSLIKFGVDNDATVNEMSALQTHFKGFQDQSRETQTFNQSQTDRATRLGDEELSRQQLAADRLRKGIVQGRQDTQFSQAQEGISHGLERRPVTEDLSDRLTESQIQRNLRPPAGARTTPKVPAYIAPSNRQILKYLGASEFDSLDDTNQAKYLEATELVSQQMSQLPDEAARNANVQNVTNSVLRTLDQRDKSADSLDAIPQKSLFEFFDDDETIAARVAEALQTSTPQIVMQQMIDKGYSEEDVNGFFTAVQQQGIQKNMDDVLNLRGAAGAQ